VSPSQEKPRSWIKLS